MAAIILIFMLLAFASGAWPLGLLLLVVLVGMDSE